MYFLNFHFKLRHSLQALQADHSLREFHERVRAFRLRNRERYEQARRISREAHERLVRIQESLSDLQRLNPSTRENMNTFIQSNRDTNRSTRRTREVDSSVNRAEDGNDETNGNANDVSVF